MHKIARIVAIPTASAALVLVALPAYGATGHKGPQSTEVSCDANEVKVGVAVTQGHSGDFKISYDSSLNGVGDNATWFTARSSVSGNDLPKRARVAGEVASWVSVLAAKYTTRFVRRVAENCNGPLPGNGTYGITYTVTFTK